MQVKREQAQSLKQELEEGLERWRQQVGSIVTIISPTLYCFTENYYKYADVPPGLPLQSLEY